MKLQRNVDELTIKNTEAGLAGSLELTKAEEDLNLAKERLDDLQEEIQEQQEHRLQPINWFKLMRSEYNTFEAKNNFREEEEIIEDEPVPVLEPEIQEEQLPRQELGQYNQYPFTQGIRWPGQKDDDDDDDNLFS